MIDRIDTTAAAAPRERDSKLRAVALDFERQLVEQLAKGLVQTAQPAEDEDAEGGAAAGFYREMLPGTLADAVAKGGGIGLAPELERALAGAAETRS
jgi:Rod binding domain-containing protein